MPNRELALNALHAQWACPYCRAVFNRSTALQRAAESGAMVFAMSSGFPTCPRCHGVLDGEFLSSGGYDVHRTPPLETWSPSEYLPAAFVMGIFLGGMTLWLASYWLSAMTSWLLGLGVGAGTGLLIYAQKPWVEETRKRKAENWRKQEAKDRRDALQRIADERGRRASLPRLSPADMELVERLISSWPGYLPRREGEVRDIGCKLNASGGHRLMLAAHQAVADRLGRQAASHLDAAWSGIGDWLW